MSYVCGSGRTTLPPIVVQVPGLQGPEVDAEELLKGVIRYDRFVELTDDQKETVRLQIGAASADGVPDLRDVYLQAKNAE